MDKLKLWQHVMPVVIVILSLVIGLIVKRTVIRKLSTLAEKSTAKLDDILLDALRSVIVLWFVLLGLYISIQILPLSQKDGVFLQKVFQTLFVLSIFWFFMQLLGKTFLVYSEKLQKRIPAASIFKNTLKIFVFSIGVLIVLQTLGISITPIITTLGVGGLAVALALQDTLANLFAGFHIIGTRRVKPKDYIKLDSGIEGYVEDVTWRDTVLRQIPNNYVIIPNSVLSSAVVTNYYQPQQQMILMMEVGIDYESDLEHVEKVTLEIAAQTQQEAPGGSKKYEPFMRYHTFGDSSINFTVRLSCEEYSDKFLVEHEFIKRLKKRYDSEGINIPYPIRTVIMKKENPIAGD
ncbi:MAG: mechanosensitive ion channel family protein [bacterium]|nr:mechanosensitive ion channel family protein [bacterium]